MNTSMTVVEALANSFASGDTSLEIEQGDGPQLLVDQFAQPPLVLVVDVRR
jgi:hypothetical protein